MGLSGKVRADLLTKFKIDDDRYLVPIEIPGQNGKRTPEETEAAKTLIDGIKQEYPGAFIAPVKWGWRVFMAIVIEGDRDLYRTIMHEEDVVQKRKRSDERCIISDGNGHAVRCPSQLPNLEYNPNKPQGKGNRKTIMNNCNGCPYNNFDRPDFTTQSLNDIVEMRDGDEEEIPDALKMGMQREADRYLAARKEVLDMIAKKYPDKLPEFTLRLAEWNRNEIAERLDKNPSGLYKLGKGITNDLWNLLDSLWYLSVHRRHNS